MIVHTVYSFGFGFAFLGLVIPTSTYMSKLAGTCCRQHLVYARAKYLRPPWIARRTVFLQSRFETRLPERRSGILSSLLVNIDFQTVSPLFEEALHAFLDIAVPAGISTGTRSEESQECTHPESATGKEIWLSSTNASSGLGGPRHINSRLKKLVNPLVFSATEVAIS